MDLIRQRARFEQIIGILVFLICGVALYFEIRSFKPGEYSIKTVMMLSCLFFCGIILLVTGIREFKDPYKSTYLKRNPDLFKMAEDIVNNEIYRDKYIVLSGRVIACVENPLQMSYTEDVFLVYPVTEKQNGLTVTKQLKMYTLRGIISLDILSETAENTEILLHHIRDFCPNVKVGDTPENRAYLDKMRKARGVNI